ncbi:MAG TPA: aspartate 1-decarboxylase [Acetivibrio clariflavus]|mgnify:CR=1 FL=1|nr:aspartate 1-decarboxylase [Acetivibrio clariflavus]HPU42564.1 aspartate 1-decarboxylase [Acetivibrio clariflavus]
MFVHLMKSKIHRAVVTESNLNYVGSITIDEDLMDAADIMENEKVQVVNNNNGNRFETYVIPGKRGSGMICLNGAAARLVQPGDIIIIISYGLFEKNEAKNFNPKIVFVDENNKIVEIKGEEEHGEIYTPK